MWIQEAHPPDKTKSTKTTATLGDEKPTCANQWGRGRGEWGGEGNTKKQYKRIAEHDPFPFSPDPPSPPICAQERGNDKTDIFKKLGRCLRKTIAKPNQNQNPTAEPTKAVQKDEIQQKNRLR